MLESSNHQGAKQFIKLARPLLAKISIDEILERKARFRELNLRNIPYEILKQQIKRVLEININGDPYIINTVSSKAVGENGIRMNFYRIRKLTEEDIKANKAVSMQIPDDAWYPPTQFAKQNRLNKKGEPFLYMAADIQTAILETHLEENDLFYLIVYKVRAPFRIASLTFWDPVIGLTTEENTKLKLFNDFLISEFVKEVGIGTEHLYNVTEIVGTEMLQDIRYDIGWEYPSTLTKRTSNLCFKPDVAKNYLDLLGVRVCKFIDKTILGFAPMIDTVTSGPNGKFIYISPNSELSRETFKAMNSNYGTPSPF